MSESSNPVPGWLESASQERQEIYSQAKELLESKEYDKAKEQIDRLVELLGGETECNNKGYDEIFWLRGEIKSGLAELCHQDFLTAYQISNPKKLEYVKRAALECKKQYSNPWNFTLASAIEWVAADPNDLEAKIVLLEGCEARNYYESVQSTRQSVLQEALKTYPDNPDINYHQARYLQAESSNNDQIVTFLIKAVDGKPNNKDWRQQLIVLLQKAKKEDRQKVLKYLLLEVEDNPKDVRKLEDVARYHEYFQRWNDAVETRKKIIELDPSSAERRQKLEIVPLEKLLQNSNAGAETLLTRKKKVQQMIHIGPHVAEPALELATQLVKENPEDNRLKVLRADVLWLDYDSIEDSQREDTFNQIKEIRDTDKPYWRTHFTLASYYQQRYIPDLSLEHYRKANELKPNNYRILKRKITMERGYGDNQLVLKDYDDFFRITADFSELPSYLRFVQNLNLWKRVTEAAELAQKVGITDDFSSELEHSKKHQQLDDDIEKQPSTATFEARGDAWLSESKTSLAKEDFKKAQELSPSNPNLRVKVLFIEISLTFRKLAKVYTMEYNLDGAKAELNTAIQQDPNNAEAYHQRSLCQSDNPIAAATDAEKACELKPDNIDFWKQLKSVYREAARFQDAARVVKKLMEMVPPDDIRYLKIELAEYYQDWYQWIEATALYKEVDMQDESTKCEQIAEILKSMPTPAADNMNQVAEEYQKIVDIMVSMYKTATAFRMMKKLIESEPLSKSAAMHGVLASMSQREYQTAEAKRYYQIAAELEPENPKWLVGQLDTIQTWNLEQHEKEPFVDSVFQACEKGGELSATIWTNVITVATELGKYDTVLKAYDQYVKRQDSEAVWTMRGVFCEDYAKNNEEALKSYIRACELNPTNENCWNNRALILNKLGDHTEAFRCAQKAIELNPNFAYPYASVAMVYLTQGKLFEAKEYAEKSIQMSSYVPRGYFVLGNESERFHIHLSAQIMEQKQQFHDAKSNYEKFLNIGHPDPDLVRMGQEGLVRCEKRIELEQQTGTSKYEDHHYHLFLSHYQRTGGLLAMVLKLLLEQSDPTLKIFLDVDDLENIHDLKANVRNSDTVALLVTEGVFERRFVIEEITTALELGKNIILIWDKERCPWPDPKTVPDHLQKVLLVRAIIWNAEKDFRSVVVHQIESKITRTDHSPNPQTPQHHGLQQPQAAVSTEQFEQIKSSIQQQYDSFSKLIQQQNELLQQTLAQQNQMFLQLQSNFTQLQQKVEALSSNAPASPPAAPTPVAATEPPKPEPVQSKTEPVPAITESNQRKSMDSQPAQPTPEPEQPKSEAVAPSQQEQNNNNARNSVGEDPQPKSRSETSSPLVKPRTASNSPPVTQVKQVYTMEGWLHKLGGWNKTKWESRYFTCDGSVMIYHTSQQIIQVTSPKGSINLKDIISVEEVAFDVYKVNCCFAVQVPNKKYFFYADDEMSKFKWIAALRRKPT